MRSSKETTRVTPPAFVLDSEHNSSRSFYKNVTSLLATISRKIISTWFCCANVSLTTSLNEYGIKGGDIEGSINGVVSVSVFPSLDKFSKVRTVAGERLCWRGCVEADEISSAKTNEILREIIEDSFPLFRHILKVSLEDYDWQLKKFIQANLIDGIAMCKILEVTPWISSTFKEFLAILQRN